MCKYFIINKDRRYLLKNKTKMIIFYNLLHQSRLAPSTFLEAHSRRLLFEWFSSAN